MSKKINNDERISQLLQAIEKKKKELGQRPRVSYITNGNLNIVNDIVNINTLTSVNAIAVYVAELLSRQHFLQEAEKLLGVKLDSFLTAYDSYNGVKAHSATIDDCLHDLKLRFEVLNWEARNKQLKAMEANLKKLVSEDTRTAMEIDEIESLL